MAKLKAKDNVLATFLSQQNLPESELQFLKPCGSDGMSVYLNHAYVCDLQHIESTSIETIPKRLWRFKDLTWFQACLYVCLVFAAPWLWSYVKPYLPDDFYTYLWIVIAIYACVDAVVWLIKKRQSPKIHYQLKLHTHFGEEHVFACAQSQETLLLLQKWLQHNANHLQNLPTEYCKR